MSGLRSLAVALSAVSAYSVLGCGGGDSTSPAASAASAASIVVGHAAARTLAGHAIDTVTVEIHDGRGNLFVAKPVTVSLGLQALSGATGTLSGPRVTTSSGGVARFTGISIATPGQYVLTFSAAGLPTVTQPIEVDPTPVVIDSTVLRLVSDSVALSQGVYTFTGAGSASIDTGRVILGAQAGGFLRRVTSVSRSGNSVTAQTVDAALNEIIQNDSLVVQFASGTAGVSGALRQRFVPLTPSFTRTSNEAFAITNLTLASASGSAGLVVSSASLGIVPAMQFTVHFGDLRQPVRSVHVAMQSTVTFQAQTTLGFSSTLSKSGSVPLGTLEFATVVPVGPLPVPVQFELPITLEWNLGIQGNLDLTFGWSSSATTTVGADWTANGGWQPAQSGTFSFTPQFPTPEINASGTVHLGIQATPRIVVAGVAGGDVYVQPFAEGDASVDLIANSWSTSCKSAIDVGLDLDLKVLSVTLASFTKGTELAASTWPICAHSGPLLASLTVTPTTASLFVGGSVALTATVSGSSDKSVTWASSSPTVASVDTSGLVRALAVGATQIVAHHSSGLTASTAVTVSPRPDFFGEVTDPAGDAIPYPGVVAPDLVDATASVTSGLLTFDVHFASGTFDPATTVVELCLDTDQNPATGYPGLDNGQRTPEGMDRGVIGCDYLVDAGSAGYVRAYLSRYDSHFNDFVSVADFAFSASSDGYSLSIPLSAIGNANGQINFKVVTQRRLSPNLFTTIRDVIPNVGLPPGRTAPPT